MPNLFPYTNTHELNLDWILQVVKDFQTKYTTFDQALADALAAITAGKVEALDEISTDLTAALNDIEASQTAALTAIGNTKDSALADIGTALTNATNAISALNTTVQGEITTLRNTSLSEITTAQGTAISAITASQNHATTIIEQLYNTLPASAQDILGKLELLDNIITGNTMESFTWQQGDYVYGEGVTPPTPPAVDTSNANYNYLVSNRYMMGVGGRRLRVITDGTIVMQYLLNWRNTPPGGAAGAYVPGQSDYFTSTYLDLLLPLDITAISLTLSKPGMTETISPTDITGHIEIQWITDFVSQRIIAPKESSTTADVAREEGEYFFLDGDMYKATDDIAVGDTIAEGTNCEKKTVGGELSDLKINVTKIGNETDEVYNDVFGNKSNDDYTGSSSTASNTSIIWFYVDPHGDIKIDTVEFWVLDAQINFYLVNYTEGQDLTYTSLFSFTPTPEQYGTLQRVSFDAITLTQNQFIGVNGKFKFSNASDVHTTRNYTIESGVVTGVAHQFLFFNYLYLGGIGGEVEKLVEDAKKEETKRNGEIVLYNAKLTSENADIVGTQAFDSFGLKVDNMLVLNKYYSVSDRTARFMCKFSSNTVAQIGTALLSGSTYSKSTTIAIDIANKTITDQSLVAKTCKVLNSINPITISLTKQYQYLSVDITDMVTGLSETITFTFNGTGGVGEGAVGTKVDTGMQYDYYYMDLKSGTYYSVNQIVIVCATCDLLIYGDSISEPEAYWPHDIFNKSWTQLIREKMNKRAMTSGRSGTALPQIMERIVNELPFIRPKYCMITIGTNSAPTVSQLTELVQYIKSQDVIPILNHIPCGNNNGDTTYFITVNERIDTVRSSENIKGCDFDKATSTGRNGTTPDTSTMWYETYTGGTYYYHHPNVKGSANMFAQLLLDVPEIFS